MKVSIFGVIEELNIEGNCSYSELESLIGYINLYSNFKIKITYYDKCYDMKNIVIITIKYKKYEKNEIVILDKYSPSQFGVFELLKEELEKLKQDEKMTLGKKTWKECGNEMIRFYGNHYLSKEYKNMLYGLINECESNKYGNYGFIYITKREGKMLLKLLRKLIFDKLTNINDNYVSKQKVKDKIKELENIKSDGNISGSDLSIEEFNKEVINILKELIK